MNTPTLPTSRETDFFLPALCRGEALFSLVLLAELLVMVLVLAESATPAFDWSRLALMSFFVQWVVLLTVTLLCLLRPWLIHLSSLYASLLACLLTVLVTLACTAASQHVQIQVQGFISAGQGGLALYLKNSLISLIMSGMVVRIFYLQSQARRRQRAELQARLQALQARIRPHFLFNSLNSIASLIQIAPDKAELALLVLSALFRAVLRQDNSLSTWQHELALAQQYLSLEQHRLGERLQLDWHIDGVPDTLPIPHLSLQPLLENAILHGIQPLSAGGTIVVQASVTQNTFSLRIDNPLPAAAPRHKGNGMALENIRLRLTALFGPAARLTCHSSDTLFSIQISYPFTAASGSLADHERTDRR
ncbi:MAG: histidine kinase [Thiopseudomonas sp.]|nr:histidine kinase [Thiopseudomonas sp.]